MGFTFLFLVSGCDPGSLVSGCENVSLFINLVTLFLLSVIVIMSLFSMVNHKIISYSCVDRVKAIG